MRNAAGCRHKENLFLTGSFSAKTITFEFMKRNIKAIFWILWMLGATSAIAQRATEAGIFLGASNYQGEFSPSFLFLKETRPAFGVLYNRFLDPNWCISGGLSFGRISGSDAHLSPETQRYRNWSFRAGLLELAANVQYHPWGKPRLNAAGLFFPRLSPYVASGIGVAFAEAKISSLSTQNTVSPESDDKNTFFSIPMTLGLRFVCSDRLTLIGEFSQRAVFSDYLDGVSQRGNPETKDWYSRFGLGLTYTLMAEY